MLRLTQEMVEAIKTIRSGPEDTRDAWQTFCDQLGTQIVRFQDLAMDATTSDERASMCGYARACRDIWRGLEFVNIGAKNENSVPRRPEGAMKPTRGPEQKGADA